MIDRWHRAVHIWWSTALTKQLWSHGKILYRLLFGYLISSCLIAFSCPPPRLARAQSCSGLAQYGRRWWTSIWSSINLRFWSRRYNDGGHDGMSQTWRLFRLAEDDTCCVIGNGSGEAVNSIGESRYCSLGVRFSLVKWLCWTGSDWKGDICIIL